MGREPIEKNVNGRFVEAGSTDRKICFAAQASR